MFEAIFSFLEYIINMIMNILLTPLVAVLSAFSPTLNDVFAELSVIFNNYIWDLFYWIPSFLKNALHIPDFIFIAIADCITLSITLYAVIRLCIAFKNIWQYFHGNFDKSVGGRLGQKLK